ncbi:hypothetical protein DBA20_20630 [Pandoraea capi]|nr:hypothetical protein [Pandoraea sp. LA3]MDN4585383.1 hypothetical protein [Pandoraea capi]
MGTPSGDGRTAPTRCPRCGAEVACGARITDVGRGAAPDVAGTTPDSGPRDVQCWCLDWPRLPASARQNVDACLCPTCLREALLAAGVSVDGTAADPGDVV